MKELIKPYGLRKGDTLATISISGGRAGDEDLRWRYKLGKKRLQDLFGVNVIETPHAMCGTDFLYRNPKIRAEDLMWAFQNLEVKGIIANMGGDDAVRILPYLDQVVIRKHPKVLMGYSDITVLTTYLAEIGIMSYYGPNVLTPIAQPGDLDKYTKEAIVNTLFTNKVIGEVLPCKQYTSIEWQDKKAEEIKWIQNTGYELLQGKGTVEGRLFGGCAGPFQMMMGTAFYPTEEIWENSILFLDLHSPYQSVVADLHILRALNVSGAFQNVAGLMFNKLCDEEKEMLLKFLKYEVHREDLPVLTNVDFGHRTPMTILPIGAMAKINCEEKRLYILESGVKE